MPKHAAENVQPNDHSPRLGQYQVVARRYRPQSFDELVGQQHVAQALANAISTHRVGHAYLFTGARGVGKTSTARILAKALNCRSGPSPNPCNRCELCLSIGSGDDVDVLEIDGASNRGIDEIRQLRQNVSIRPTRARYKIYIIDEVHMLTREAFNALLKTLEEPPPHVKFIFCTTEPTKIPATILSRCQRFDFAGIQTSSIVQRLEQIVRAEAVEADREALEIIARRAAGSMRDAQSLLEQLLAFAPGRITAADVHQMLGAATDQRVARLAELLAAGDAAGCLAELDAACNEGVDLGLLLEQLCGVFRDAMAAAVGCSPESFAYTAAHFSDEPLKIARKLGLTNILAALQILDQTLWRLRSSTQGRILAELALVRIARLENLEELASLIGRLKSGRLETARPQTTGRSAGLVGPSPKAESTAARPSPPAQLEDTVAGVGVGPDSQASSRQVPGETESDLPTRYGASGQSGIEDPEGLWRGVLSEVGGILAAHGKDYDSVSTAGPNLLVVTLKAGYTLAKSICEKSEQLAKLQAVASRLAGTPVKIEFRLATGGSSPAQRAGRKSGQMLLRQVANHPMVREAGELFGAMPSDVRPPDNDPEKDT